MFFGFVTILILCVVTVAKLYDAAVILDIWFTVEVVSRVLVVVID